MHVAVEVASGLARRLRVLAGMSWPAFGRHCATALSSCAPIIACGLLLSACATAFRDPLNVQVASAAAVVPASVPPDVSGNTVLALAFSGGGTRAAAFAHGVMRGLDRIPAAGGGTSFDKIVFISGVSGGSVAAAYYGLRGRAALSDF